MILPKIDALSAIWEQWIGKYFDDCDDQIKDDETGWHVTRMRFGGEK
jgi:hypothetical protein